MHLKNLSKFRALVRALILGACTVVLAFTRTRHFVNLDSGRAGIQISAQFQPAAAAVALPRLSEATGALVWTAFVSVSKKRRSVAFRDYTRGNVANRRLRFLRLAHNRIKDDIRLVATDTQTVRFSLSPSFPLGQNVVLGVRQHQHQQHIE